jgi:3-dehydroquinate synthase
VIDVSFAATVLDGVWRAGVGEAVRYAAVSDSSLMKKIAKNAERLKSRDLEVFSDLVRSVVASRAKKGSTSFALWSANRLESMSGYKLPHGYAVSIGICVEAEYALLKGWLKESERDAIRALLGELGAIDGLEHSRHLFSQPDNVLFGLDAWRLSTGSQGVMVPCGIGKLKSEPEPDREIYNQVLCRFCEEAN